MDRLQKKCFVGSACGHACAAVLLVIGSAFFIEKENRNAVPRVTLIPGRLVDNMMSGGGGNPALPPSNEQLKGDTLVPQPAPAPTPPAQPAPKPPEKAVQKQAPPKVAQKPTP